MKKIIFLIAITAFSYAASAQQTHSDTGSHTMKGMSHMKDCLVMKNGNMMVMKNGETSPMSQDMTLSNGTMVMTDGTVKTKSGKTMHLSNNEAIYMDGHMAKMKSHGYMNKDSSQMHH